MELRRTDDEKRIWFHGMKYPLRLKLCLFGDYIVSMLSCHKDAQERYRAWHLGSNLVRFLLRVEA